MTGAEGGSSFQLAAADRDCCLNQRGRGSKKPYELQIRTVREREEVGTVQPSALSSQGSKVWS